MTIFKRVSDLLKNADSSLIVNRTCTEDFYDILQFQPYGKASYSHESGIRITEALHEQKALDMLKIARANRTALVVTPEGSIPYSIIKGIINNCSLWPDKYVLWCLCAEGIESITFEELVVNTEENKSIHMVIESNITYKKHVNALWYIFRESNDKLAVVVQLKQCHMLDRMLQHEATDLSLGNTVYIFDLNNGKPTKNVLLSLICADAIQLPSSEIINSVTQCHPIIINPQFNQEPFSPYFVSFRKTYFSDTSITKKRLVTVNWAVNSVIIPEKPLVESGSIYYTSIGINGKSYLEAISKDADLFRHRNRMQERGMAYFCDFYYNIWCIGNCEQTIRYYAKKEDCFGVNSALSPSFDPEVIETYLFDEHTTEWIENRKNKCSVMLDRSQFHEYLPDMEDYLPMNYERCVNMKCEKECLWLINDYFFGVCFGGLLKDEIKSENETSNRMLLELNENSTRQTKRKRSLFRKLTELLKNDIIPESLSLFINNNKFDIDSNCALTGSNNVYNVSVKSSPTGHQNWYLKKGIFAIIDTDDFSEVEELYGRIQKATRLEYQDQIVVYYRKNDKFIPYDSPHNVTKISKSSNGFTNPISSVYGGMSQYERH